jgi:hypothetical protein
MLRQPVRQVRTFRAEPDRHSYSGLAPVVAGFAVPGSDYYRNLQHISRTIGGNGDGNVRYDGIDLHQAGETRRVPFEPCW